MSNLEDDSKSGTKHVLTNKERARIARKRKKQYYEDLEKKNKYLEDQVKQLTKEVKIYKEQAQKASQDGQDVPMDINDQKNISCLSNECLNMIR